MHSADSIRARVIRWLSWKVMLFGLNVVAFLFIAAPLGASAGFFRNSLLWLTLNAGAGLALLVGILYTLVILAMLSGIEREHFKGDFGVLRGGLAGFAVGATAVLAYIFAGVSFAMATLGWVSYASSKGPEDTIVDLSETYMWHVYDLIPGIEVNRSLGQDMPRLALESVSANGATDNRGILLVVFRVIVALVLFRTVLRLFERPKPEPPSIDV